MDLQALIDSLDWKYLVVCSAKVFVLYHIVIVLGAVMTLAERKVSAWMQYRIGPNRVGPWGLLQPLADGVKFIFKEEVLPDGANPVLFRLAPAIAAIPAMMTLAVIPFSGEITELNGFLDGRTTYLSIADIDIGVLYLLAIGGLSVYGIILGGWVSNSKFSLMGGLRASAQMISYELTLILSILAVVAMAGSLSLREIVDAQQASGLWFIVQQPLGFVLFLVAIFAETNRHPFDFAECESELVGGFHTEYSSMKFALFFLGEYTAMIVMSCLGTALFLGGHHIPFFADAHWALGFLAFMAKTSLFLFLFLWVRWTLPRFRFDQLMRLGWKVMLPLALANLIFTGALISLK
jgi:NADH-quinone oxidoreductase subunit H